MLAPKPSSPGPERYVLGLALLVPLGLAAVLLLQLPGVSMGRPATLVYADTAAKVFAPRPAPSNPEPPPTLAIPTATPRPTPTPVPPSPTPEPSPTAGPRTYVVQRGDELKYIAAEYGVSIWRIISTNDIPDPDSLNVGQVLRIPAD
jgi:LysM repeat protein